MLSIVSNERRCLICHATHRIRTHNVFYGDGIEKLSEKYGCWCYLCVRHHNSEVGAHFNTALDRKLKEHTQRRFNEVYPELDFLQIFGKNYL